MGEFFSENLEVVEGETWKPKTAQEMGIRGPKNTARINRLFEQKTKELESRERTIRAGNSYATEAQLKSHYDKVMKQGSELEKMKLKEKYRKL